MKDKHGQTLTIDQLASKVANRLHAYAEDLLLMLLNIITWIPLHWFRHLCFWLAGLNRGQGSTLHTGIRFYQPHGITIGEDTIIGDRTFLDGRAPLTIGNHVDIASQVLIYNSQHDLAAPDFHAISRPVTIHDYVFIGPRAIILPGVTVGEGSVIAAGAVVTKDVDPYTVVAGVPAKRIKDRPLKKANYILGRSRLFQ